MPDRVHDDTAQSPPLAYIAGRALGVLWSTSRAPLLVCAAAMAMAMLAIALLSLHFDNRLNSAEARLAAAHQENELAVTEMRRDIREMRDIIVQALSKDLLGGSPEAFADDALATSSEAQGWPEETRTAFRGAVAARWGGAVQSLADRLSADGGVNQNQLLRVSCGEMPADVFSQDEMERVVTLSSDVSFRLFYDAAYAIRRGSLQ